MNVFQTHGTGFEAELPSALQTWATQGGARWLRLGVVSQNLRAARFQEEAPAAWPALAG